jgi:hypothetical protein
VPVGGTRRPRTGRRPGGLGDLGHLAGQAQAPRGQRGTERLAVSLASQPGAERFQSPGRVKQEQPPVVTTARAGGQLGAQQLCPGPPELIQRAAVRHGQQAGIRPGTYTGAKARPRA